MPNDETGDCQLFTTRLAEMAKEAGVEFRYGVDIRKLQFNGNAIDGVVCSTGTLTADAYVLALGSYSRLLLEGRMSVPVYTLKGYSITVPVDDELAETESNLLDATNTIALTSFDHRLRVGGMTAVFGYHKTLNPKRPHTLEVGLTALVAALWTT